MKASVFVDAGNSRIKWAIAAGAEGTLEGHGVLTHGGRHAGLGAEQAAQVVEAVEGEIRARGIAVRDVWLISVAGEEVAGVLSRAFEARLACPAHCPRVMREFAGLRVAYPRLENLGVDRWVAMLGARHIVGYPCVVADCGTALTVDAVDARGNHLGGAIAPGRRLQRTALLTGTARIRAEDTFDVPAALFAADTGAAVGAGVDHALAGLIERAHRFAVERIGVQEASASLPLVLTGGDAAALRPLLRVTAVEVDDLVLHGARLIAEAAARAGG